MDSSKQKYSLQGTHHIYREIYINNINDLFSVSHKKISLCIKHYFQIILIVEFCTEKNNVLVTYYHWYYNTAGDLHSDI